MDFIDSFKVHSYNQLKQGETASIHPHELRWLPID